MARVSIILIYYRVIPYLRPAVRSLLDQTWRDLEVILVDNGTGAGLAPLGEDANDPRVRLVSLSTNLGYSRGFSAGLAQCSGEFVSMMGIDDIALPARIEKQVALLRVEPRLGVVSSLAKMIDEHGTIMGSEFALVEERDHFVFTAYSTSAPSPTYTCRRAVFEQFPFRLDFDLAEDYDFLSRALEVWPMRSVPEVLVHYRCHPGQTTKQYHAEQTLRACLIRLLTARRRHARDEELAVTLAKIDPWLRAAPDKAAIYSYFAMWCLRDGFASLAVYHARKLLSVRRDATALKTALSVYAAALRMEPRETVLLSRLFFTGPLRAHRLKPA